MKQGDPSRYLAGTICCVHETLATPAELIFSTSTGIKEDPVVCQAHLDELDIIYGVKPSKRGRKGKKRPCLLTENVSAWANQRPGPHMRDEGPLICVMGTYGGIGPRGAMYEHFSMGVFPNVPSGWGGSPGSGASEGARDHVHTRPRNWRHPRQWLIAFRYRCPSPILSAWSFAAPDGRRGEGGKTRPEWWVDRETVGWLVAECTTRMASWNDKCEADPNFARACAVEYRVRLRRAGCSSSRHALTLRRKTGQR
ncbi:hypothetical protein C8Q77DRAFT_1065564 [Trametes polyzona]|nr:hypothetical protein C8Q77DRAFT_1065564 [Trametes polyzona]